MVRGNGVGRFWFGVLCLGFLVAAAGCTIQPGVKTMYQESEVTKEQLQEGGVAVAAVVVRQGVELHRLPDLPAAEEPFTLRDQTLYWDPQVSGKFAAAGGGLMPDPFATLVDQVDPAVLDQLQVRFADGRHPDAALWQALTASDISARYLLMLRVESDAVEYDGAPTSALMPPLESGLGRLSDQGREEPTSRPLNPSVDRTVELTLEVYDLAESRAIWEGRVKRRTEKLVEAYAPQDKARFKALDTEDGHQLVPVDEEMIDGPEFAKVLDHCLGALFAQLFSYDTPVQEEGDFDLQQ